MNSRKRIVIVAKKEIIEFIRDWRTIVALVLIPLLLFPLLFIAFPVVMQNEAAELNQKTVDILIQSNDIDDSLIDLIENQTAMVTVLPLDGESYHVVRRGIMIRRSCVTSNTMQSYE